jgi:hypothetical protein
MQDAELRQHVTILGWLHLAAAALSILAGIFLFFLLGGIGLAVNDPHATPVLGIVGALVAGFLLLISLPGVLAGYGLLQRKPWGRIMGIIVGALHLANVPLGTALGVYSFWVLTQPEAEAFFRKP